MLKRFSTFSLDTANQCVLRDRERVQLPPKAFAVLSYLVDNPGRIVTKEELLESAWPDTFVQEAVLKACILDVRKALGEDPKQPKCIATVHRRGYRFIAEAMDGAPIKANPYAAPSGLLGRDTDLKRLHALLEKSRRGERQVAFVTGEPGIGKSTLISHFLGEASDGEPIRTLRGQCIEHFGACEAYYPVFEALGRAAQDGSFPGLIAVLRTHAPSWLLEMPGATSAADREVLKQETVGATRDRMLREITEAIESLAAQQPLILVLEDLHWSDLSTLDLISWIANRTGSARLLLIASYRPVEVILSNHPIKSIKQALVARGRCLELQLELLQKEDIRAFLDLRFPQHALPDDFAALVQARTDGNPLYISNVLDYAVSRSLITNQDGQWTLRSAPGDFDLRVPESLAQMIERQIERLTSEEQSVLEIASVIGLSFAIPLVAGIGAPESGSLESCCDDMARRNLFIRSAGVTEVMASQVSARYQFTHALYRDIFYRRLSPARRVRLHRTIGEWLESVHESRLHEVASELAMHFQECHDAAKAVAYLRLVAQRCASRHALREALEALTRAGSLAKSLDASACAAAEFELTEQIGLVYRLMGQLKSSAGEFEKMFEQARRAGQVEGQLRALLWFASVSSWLDRDRCLQAVDRILDLCRRDVTPEWRVNALGQVAYWNLLFRGWDQADADASARALEAARKGSDRAALALQANRHSFFQCLSSQYFDASQTAAEGVRIAVEIESLMDYSVGHFFEALALLHLGDWGAMQRLLRSAIDMANRNGHDFWALLFGLLEAFLHIEARSFDTAQQACREYLERARELGHPLSVQIALALLGRAELGVGNVAAASELLGQIREWQGRERILMDWIWRMPLQFAFVELCLERGDLDAARQEADLFVLQTSATAERTWKGLAHYTRACVAAAEKDTSRVESEISSGLRTIKDCQAPLAAWRLHALAAKTSGSSEHLQKAEAIVRQLADSLPPDEPLRRSFLSVPHVAAIGRSI